MVRRIALSFLILGAVGLGTKSADAGPISFTGNVAQDFGLVGNPTTATTSSISGVDVLMHSTTPVHIAQPSWMTSEGLVSGWNINSIAVSYNATTDKLYVGVQTFGVAGNVDGNGTPGSPNSLLTAAGGSDPANFGGDKAMAIGIAPLPTGALTATNTPEPTIVAGISGNKAQAGTGLDGFNVAAYSANGSTGPYYQLATNFGATIGTGSLAYDPSSSHPGFEFTINNFSKLLGYNPALGFVLSAQDGSVASVVTGKDYVVPTEVTNLEAQKIGPTTPEPATWLAWTVVCGIGAAWKLRRSRTERSI
jgi:hypothetical protein